jgi:hypothetical protein
MYGERLLVSEKKGKGKGKFWNQWSNCKLRFETKGLDWIEKK